MAIYTSPLVDVIETDRSTYVSGIATTVANIVLRNTYKGDEMVSKLITNESELIDTFGMPVSKVFDPSGDSKYVSSNYQDMLSAIGYLKHGNSLYCVRTMPSSATFAGVKLDDSDEYLQFDSTNALTLRTESNNGGDISDPDDLPDEVESLMGTDQIWIVSKSRGYWGNNVRVAIVDKTTQTEIVSGGKTEWQSGNLYNIVQSLDSPIESDEDFVILVQEKPQNSSVWSLQEIWNVSLDENAKNDQGQTKFVENLINSNSMFIRISVSEENHNSTVPNEWVTENFNELGGGCDYDGDEIDDANILEAYELAENPEDIDVNLFIDSNKSETVKKRLAEISKSRMDAMLIADVKYEHVINNKGNETVDITNWRKGILSPNFNVNSSYVAIYGNWLEVYDKYNSKYRWIPASGYVAGLYAYNDQVTDPWFAPAGLERAVLNGVRRLAWNPNKAKRDMLYLSGINPIVSFSGKGKAIWGQKTMLDKSSAFNRVNVRRLFMILEESIKDSSHYFVFKPNDRDTRNQLTAMIEPFLADVKARRGIIDFLVVCDETNNTPERIDRSELWCDIYIKPVKAAEFIRLNFIATRAGIEFSEV